MMRRSMFFGGFILLALSGVAMADLADPKIVTGPGDPSGCASALLDLSNGLNVVQPVASCPTYTYNFFNDLGNEPRTEDVAAIVTGFTFQTTLATGLTGLAATFTCDTGGYFKSCDGTYNSSNGQLDYVFSGVVPEDGDEYCVVRNGVLVPKDNEIDEEEGIPACGTFHITLEGFNGVDTPTEAFTNSFTVEAPEPSTALLLLGELGLFFGILLFVRRRKSASVAVARSSEDAARS